MTYLVNHAARFTVDPRRPHTRMLRNVGRYLIEHRQGLIMQPDVKRGFEIFVDADFVGQYDAQDKQNRDNYRSRHGFLITYHGVALHWKSRLQTTIALSTTEAEFLALSDAAREINPFLDFLSEIYQIIPDLPLASSNPVCHLFEDNRGALALATENKFRARTKHIGIKFYHFRDLVTTGRLRLHAISTHDQLADIFTKPLKNPTFATLRKKIMGW